MCAGFLILVGLLSGHDLPWFWIGRVAGRGLRVRSMYGVQSTLYVLCIEAREDGLYASPWCGLDNRSYGGSFWPE